MEASQSWIRMVLPLRFVKTDGVWRNESHNKVLWLDTQLSRWVVCNPQYAETTNTSKLDMFAECTNVVDSNPAQGNLLWAWRFNNSFYYRFDITVVRDINKEKEKDKEEAVIIQVDPNRWEDWVKNHAGPMQVDTWLHWYGKYTVDSKSSSKDVWQNAHGKQIRFIPQDNCWAIVGEVTSGTVHAGTIFSKTTAGKKLRLEEPAVFMENLRWQADPPLEVSARVIVGKDLDGLWVIPVYPEAGGRALLPLELGSPIEHEDQATRGAIEGKYNMGGKANGRPYWVHHKGKFALWWAPWSKWVVGQAKNIDKAMFTTRLESRSTDLMDPLGGWKYFVAGVWIDRPDARISVNNQTVTITIPPLLQNHLSHIDSAKAVFAKELHGCITSGTCTASITRRQRGPQDWWICKTCDEGRENIGVCAVCKDICHNGHLLAKADSPTFFCDCGFGAYPRLCSAYPPPELGTYKLVRGEARDGEPVWLGPGNAVRYHADRHTWVVGALDGPNTDQNFLVAEAHNATHPADPRILWRRNNHIQFKVFFTALPNGDIVLQYDPKRACEWVERNTDQMDAWSAANYGKYVLTEEKHNGRAVWQRSTPSGSIPSKLKLWYESSENHWIVSPAYDRQQAAMRGVATKDPNVTDPGLRWLRLQREESTNDKTGGPRDVWASARDIRLVQYAPNVVYLYGGFTLSETAQKANFTRWYGHYRKIAEERGPDTSEVWAHEHRPCQQLWHYAEEWLFGSPGEKSATVVLKAKTKKKHPTDQMRWEHEFDGLDVTLERPALKVVSNKNSGVGGLQFFCPDEDRKLDPFFSINVFNMYWSGQYLLKEADGRQGVWQKERGGCVWYYESQKRWYVGKVQQVGGNDGTLYALANDSVSAAEPNLVWHSNINGEGWKDNSYVRVIEGPSKSLIVIIESKDGR